VTPVARQEDAMRRFMWLAGALVGAAVVTAGAQSEPYSGAADYQVYCSSCHGTGGKGDGSIAKMLKKRPTDLTQLAKQNKDAFPDEKIFKTIDGRGSSAHADSDMPSWGEVFAKSTESPGTEKSALRIRTLVRYLETLQVKP
jgi:mono/diheme cytochrome c family protein